MSRVVISTVFGDKEPSVKKKRVSFVEDKEPRLDQRHEYRDKTVKKKKRHTKKKKHGAEEIFVIKRDSESTTFRGFICKRHGLCMGNWCNECLLPHQRWLAKRRLKKLNKEINRL